MIKNESHDEEPIEYQGADNLFLSIKLMITYEMFMQLGFIWKFIIPFHFGIL